MKIAAETRVQDCVRLQGQNCCRSHKLGFQENPNPEGKWRGTRAVSVLQDSAECPNACPVRRKKNQRSWFPPVCRPLGGSCRNTNSKKPLRKKAGGYREFQALIARHQVEWTPRRCCAPEISYTSPPNIVAAAFTFVNIELTLLTYVSSELSDFRKREFKGLTFGRDKASIGKSGTRPRSWVYGTVKGTQPLRYKRAILALSEESDEHCYQKNQSRI